MGRAHPQLFILRRPHKFGVFRQPQRRKRALRPGLAVGAQPQLRHVELPTGALAAQRQRQIVYVQPVLRGAGIPVGRPLLEQRMAAGDLAVLHLQPGCQAEVCAFQPGVGAQPAGKPGFHVDVIGLQIDRAGVQQALIIAQVHAQLHHTVLAVQRRQADLPLGAVAIAAVEPGQLGNVEFGARAGGRQERDTAVAQIEMVELAQHQIADFTGLKAVALTIAAQRGVQIEAELIEGQIAELPAPVQQRLPHVQRQRHAFDMHIAFGQRNAQVAHFKLWAERFPTALQEIHLHRHTG